MDLRRWKRNDAVALLAALLAGPLLAGMWLAGCGGGGGGSAPAPLPTFMVRGTVFAPRRNLTSVGHVAVKQTGTLYGPAAAGVRVEVGFVNNAGEGFSLLAATTTDSLGGYTLALPAGVGPGPNLVVRAIGSTVLENIVTGPTVDISPETTAAVNLLFSTARTRGIAISRLNLGLIGSYISTATDIAQLGNPAGTTADAVSSASSIIQRAPNAIRALNAVLGTLGPVGTPIPTTGTPQPTRTPAPRATSTPGGGPPTPPGGGTPTPTRKPTPTPGGATPTPFGGTPTPVPTKGPTPGATFLPTPGGTPNPTPLPTPKPTAVGNPTPQPTANVTPFAPRGRSR